MEVVVTGMVCLVHTSTEKSNPICFACLRDFLWSLWTFSFNAILRAPQKCKLALWDDEELNRSK